MSENLRAKLNSGQALLTLDDLVISFHDPNGSMTAVKGVDLTIEPGETLALVGESGCGKTVLCKSLMGFLCARGEAKANRMEFLGQDLRNLSERQRAAYRGTGIAMIPQDPMMSLDPVVPVGEQIAEAVRIARARRGASADATNTALSEAPSEGAKLSAAPALSAEEEAARLMEQVGIDGGKTRYNQRPYQFSGGMRQRVVIAIALATKPRLLLADEPTTALDEQTQGEILQLIRDVQKSTGAGMLFITHDLHLVEDMAQRVAIMRSGKLVEEGPVKQVFAYPQNPYTEQLLGYLDYHRHRGHDHRAPAASDEVVLSVEHLEKRFGDHRVLRDFSLDAKAGEIVGIIGPSGCGKSTLTRCIMDIEPVDGGTISVPCGRDRVQMIFQDSQDAFNSMMTVREIIAEPLRIRRKESRDKIEEKVFSVMEEVGLDDHLADRRPGQLSGGQRQRAAIARAIITDPALIIADEPLTGLDVTAQAKIVHLLRELVTTRGLSLLLIAHDRPMVEHVSSRIIEMG